METYNFYSIEKIKIEELPVGSLQPLFISIRNSDTNNT